MDDKCLDCGDPAEYDAEFKIVERSGQYGYVVRSFCEKHCPLWGAHKETGAFPPIPQKWQWSPVIWVDEE